MSHQHIIRAWKDEDYRLSLSDEERAQLPEHPAGLIELTLADLGHVAGALPVLSVNNPDACDTLPRYCPRETRGGCDLTYGVFCGPTQDSSTICGACSSGHGCTILLCPSFNDPNC